MTRRRRLALLSAAFSVILVLAGAAAIDDVNPTWDEALGELFFGERTFEYFRTFDPVMLDVSADPWGGTRQPDLGLSPFRIRPWEYPPVAPTLGAAVREVLSRRLGLLDDFDGFHALNIVLALAFVPLWLAFLDRRIGTGAAVVATGVLFTGPRLFAHWVANIKDVPTMFFFALVLAAGLRAIESGRPGRVVAVGALWGIALGTKFNALFLPLIPAIALVGGRFPERWRGRVGALLGSLAGASVLGGLTLVLVWPWTWADPIGRIGRHVAYIAGRAAYTPEHAIAPVLHALATTTPPVVLLLVGVGLVPLGRRLVRREPFAWWILAWILVVLGRYALPGAVNFDGVRHFLEVFPALGIVAGLGLAALVDIAVAFGRVRRSVVAPLAVALALAPGAAAVVATHPFPIAYWNAFAGGPGGAWEAGHPQAGDYWGLSYRVGLRWLEEHAERDAFLAVPVVEHTVRLVASERLRPDLTLLPVTTPFSPRIAPERRAALDELASRRTVYVMFVPRRDWMNGLMVDCLTGLRPEVVWELDGAPILLIYRYRPEDVEGAG